MVGREKVKTGIFEMLQRDTWKDIDKERHRFQPVLNDVRSLLNEQETADTGKCRVFQCEKCGYGIEDIFVNDEFKYPIDPRYCPNCGRLVKGDA